jgi:LysR family transcriptional regulator, cyn operon transcriptional activator
MTLNQLRTFLAVAEHESVHGAAQELVVTQAAVSASLATLQKALGVALAWRPPPARTRNGENCGSPP